MRGLDVLVNESALVHFPERGGDTNGEPQKCAQLHRTVEKLLEQVPTGVLEEQELAAALMHELQRTRRPLDVQLIFERVFMRQTIEDARGWVLGSRMQDEHGLIIAVAAPGAR
jgi:hypothetical protein